jgi:Serine aminopeptidase, S33
MNRITTKDGTQIYFKDWGSGQPVVFSHGWPLTADAWESQMFFLASHGYRCIAHDRRGHVRSGQPWNGNDMDTYADDLAELFKVLDPPQGKFAGASKSVSEALGRKPQSTDLNERHPFDVEILRIPAGKIPYPFHPFFKRRPQQNNKNKERKSVWLEYLIRLPRQ